MQVLKKRNEDIGFILTGKKTPKKIVTEIKTLNKSDLWNGWIHLERERMDKEKIIGKKSKLIVETNDDRLKNKKIYFRFKNAEEEKVLKKKMDLVLKPNGDIITQLTYDPSIMDNKCGDYWSATVVAYLKDGTVVKEATFTFQFEGKYAKVFFCLVVKVVSIANYNSQKIK